MKKAFALIMVVLSLCSLFSMPVYSGETGADTVIVDGVEFVFDMNTTEDFRNEFIAHYLGENDDDSTTYGLMCTLFGHKLESSVITVITHKAKSTSPRCLRERYDTEACTRCDYTYAELISETYIFCCD